jgi:hypothetical protein
MTDRAERAKRRKRERELGALHPIARQVQVLENDRLRIGIDGAVIEGDVDAFNRVIERMGFRPVRITRNILNPNSPRFCIDIDTPTYCDPGCEAYHQM